MNPSLKEPKNLQLILTATEGQTESYTLPWDTVSSQSPYFAAIRQAYGLEPPQTIIFTNIDIEAFQHVINWFVDSELMPINDEPEQSEDIVELLRVYELAAWFVMDGCKKAVFDEIQGRCNVSVVGKFFPRVQRALVVRGLSFEVMEMERNAGRYAERHAERHAEQR